MRTIKVFIASTSDLEDERDRASLVVTELGRAIGPPHNLDLKPIRWETHAWPDVGEDSQDVINRQIGDFDIFIGVLWKRFGTPTKRAESGTEEEFDRAYATCKLFGKPRIMFYFRTTPFYPKTVKELTEFRRVLKFKKRIENLGALYWTYTDPLDFERAVREHLIKQVLQAAKAPESRPSGPKVFLSSVRADANRVTEYYRRLKAEGFDPWQDEKDLVPGDRWVSAIMNAISNSDIFVTFISKNSIKAKGFVQTEIAAGLEQMRKRANPDLSLVVVRLDAVSIPTSLSTYMIVDCFDEEEGVELLAKVLANQHRRTSTRW